MHDVVEHDTVTLCSRSLARERCDLHSLLGKSLDLFSIPDK
jgi:hypothetical protein